MGSWSYSQPGRLEGDLPTLRVLGESSNSAAVNDLPASGNVCGLGNASNRQTAAHESSSQPSLVLRQNEAVAQQPVERRDETEGFRFARDLAREQLTKVTREHELTDRKWGREIKSLVQDMVVDRGFVEREAEGSGLRDLVYAGGRVDLNFVAVRPGTEEKIAVFFFDSSGENRLSHGCVLSLARNMAISWRRFCIVLVLEGDVSRQEDAYPIALAREKGLDAFTERDIIQAHKAKAKANAYPVMILQPEEKEALKYFFGLDDFTQMVNKMSVDDYFARYFGLKEGQIIKLSDDPIPQLDQFHLLC